MQSWVDQETSKHIPNNNVNALEESNFKHHPIEEKSKEALRKTKIINPFWNLPVKKKNIWHLDEAIHLLSSYLHHTGEVRQHNLCVGNKQQYAVMSQQNLNIKKDKSVYGLTDYG